MAFFTKYFTSIQDAIIDGEVNTYAELPPANEHYGEIWLVIENTDILSPFRTNAGLYSSNGTTWVKIPISIDASNKVDKINITPFEKGSASKTLSINVNDQGQILSATEYNLNTSNIVEGSNLYYTDERVDDEVALLIQNNSGITWSYDDGAGTLTPTITHNSLPDLQGGNTTERYHLTAAQHTGLTGLTANRAIASDGSGNLTSSSVTATELGYLFGVTSAIQTQLDGKQPLDADLTAIAALANTDGNFIVGNGSTWVVESGNTARTSLGLGTGDSPTFSNLTLSNSSLSNPFINAVTGAAISGNVTAFKMNATAGAGTNNDELRSIFQLASTDLAYIGTRYGSLGFPYGELVLGVSNSASLVEKIAITNSGVGFGTLTNTPEAVVHIAGGGLTDLIVGNTGSSQQLMMGTASGYSSIQAILQDTGVNTLKLNKDGGDVEVGAKFGAGITSPQTQIESGGYFRITGNANAPGTGAGLQAYYNSGASEGFLQSYSRDSLSFQKLSIDSSILNINTTSGGNIVTGSNILVGNAAAPTGTAIATMMMADNGGDPTPATNTAGFFAKDVAGNTEGFGVDEAGNITQLTPHDPLTGKWYYHSVNTKTGREVTVDMEGFLKDYDARFGTSFFEENMPLYHY